MTGFGYKAPLFNELFPETDEKDQHNILRTEINKLIPVVEVLLSIVEISTTLAYTQRELQGISDSLNPQYKEKKTTVNVLGNYFDILHREELKCRETLIDAIDRGIGYFGELKKLSLRACFNPLRWIAILLRLPIMILEYANLIDSEASKTKFIEAYAWVIRALMFVLISFLAAKMGLNIDWPFLK